MQGYALVIWLLNGLINHRWWLQAGIFFLTVYLIIELSNSNALLRVRSRMVSSVFILLTCATSFTFGSLTGGLTQLFTVAALLALFQTYQEPQAAEKVYYTFLFWSLGSIPFVQLLYFVPLLWILMATQLQSLSIRTLSASFFGLATPYWFFTLWCTYQQDFSWFISHFSALASWGEAATPLTVGQWAVIVFTLILTVISMFHFWQYSFEDKIRIRLLYGFFIAMTLACTTFLIIQPQHFDPMIRLVFIMASPLIAHFFTLTSNRFTNIFFFVALAIAVIITIINLWMPSLNF